MTILRESTQEKEGILQVSRWVRLPVLIDREELQALFNALGPFEMYQVHTLCNRDNVRISNDQFLSSYSSYVESLKNGEVWNRAKLTALFSPIMTSSSDILYAMAFESDKCLVKAVRPIVQIQPYSFQYEGELRGMIFGQGSISWGLQFSYPSLFQDNKTNEIYPVREDVNFPNTTLFRSIQRWVRHHTLPTPLIIDGKKLRVPIRLGKGCFTWIHKHPQCLEKKIKIDAS